jgi:hypothetical protein
MKRERNVAHTQHAVDYPTSTQQSSSNYPIDDNQRNKIEYFFVNYINNYVCIATKQDYRGFGARR